MQITVSADGDLLIPRELVDSLSAHAGDECYAELNSTGTIISVSLMDPCGDPVDWSRRYVVRWMVAGDH